MTLKLDHYVICRIGYYFLKKYLDNLTSYAILEVERGAKMERKGLKIGEIIKQIRTKLQLRQTDVAKLSGVNHQGSLTYIEKYSRMPNFDVACRLAFALKITPNELAQKMGLPVWTDNKEG